MVRGAGQLGHRPVRVPAVPAKRIGHTQYSLAQLKIVRKACILTVFVP